MERGATLAVTMATLLNTITSPIHMKSSGPVQLMMMIVCNKGGELLPDLKRLEREER